MLSNMVIWVIIHYNKKVEINVCFFSIKTLIFLLNVSSNCTLSGHAIKVKYIWYNAPISTHKHGGDIFPQFHSTFPQGCGKLWMWQLEIGTMAMYNLIHPFWWKYDALSSTYDTMSGSKWYTELYQILQRNF